MRPSQCRTAARPTLRREALSWLRVSAEVGITLIARRSISCGGASGGSIDCTITGVETTPVMAIAA